MLAAALAALHLASMVLAIVSIVGRARSFRAPISDAKLREAMGWDTLALVASFGLYGAGLYRLFGGMEKPLTWYGSHPLFWVKMALLVVLLCLEVPTMWTLLPLEFRRDRKSPFSISDSRARLLHVVNWVEVVVAGLLVVVAAFMARGQFRNVTAAVRTTSPACDVETLYQSRCLSCHGAATKLGELDLQSDAHSALVRRPASSVPGILRVAPSSPETSLLYRKLTGNLAPHEGARMPMDRPLDDATVQTVERWIREGAPRCESR